MTSAKPGSSPATDEEAEETPTLPDYLSPSQINGLLTCGEQYRLTRVVRVPERPMFAGIGGNTVHRLTELHDLAAYEQGKA